MKPILYEDFNVKVFIKEKKSIQLTSILQANGLTMAGPDIATRESKTTKTLFDLCFKNYRSPQNDNKTL